MGKPKRPEPVSSWRTTVKTVWQTAGTYTSRVARLIARHPCVFTCLLLLTYLVVLQTQFMTSGDSWAEAFYEYVHGAVTNLQGGFLDRGIAGYFNFWPKLFSYGYIKAGLPLGYIDYFFRAVVVTYTILCVGYIAHRHNRYLIRSDGLRIGLALLTLMTYYHVTSFSFINIWYVGFIPMILVSLNPRPFRTELQALAYAAFAMSVCLTKPSLIVLPLVLYRTIKLKEWLVGFIVLFAIGLQSLLFFTSQFYLTLPPAMHISLVDKAVNTVLYLGVLALKLFRITPGTLAAVIAACIVLIGMLWFMVKLWGYVRAGLVALTAILVSYTAIYAPDTGAISIRTTYKDVFSDQMKLQREIMASFLILFAIFAALQYWTTRKAVKQQGYILAAIVVIMAGFMFRHIDTNTAGLSVDIGPFRSTLTSRSPLCMPVAPTPAWAPPGAPSGPAYPWYYESGPYRSCQRTNYLKTIDYAAAYRIDSGADIETSPPDGPGRPTALLIPILNPQPDTAATLVLEDVQTHQQFQAKIVAKSSGEHVTFVAFNLSSEQPAASYRFKLHESNVTNSKLQLTLFKDGTVAEFAYFTGA